jgi:hypothetical protein
MALDLDLISFKLVKHTCHVWLDKSCANTQSVLSVDKDNPHFLLLHLNGFPYKQVCFITHDVVSRDHLHTYQILGTTNYSLVSKIEIKEGITPSCLNIQELFNKLSLIKKCPTIRTQCFFSKVLNFNAYLIYSRLLFKWCKWWYFL